MSNSKMVSHTKISPYKSRRTEKIDTITIHCVVGQMSVESLGVEFSRPGKNASSNYGIGSDGRVGMYVEEKDRSWCSSNTANDNRAITIECASDAFHPYAINQKVYDTLIKLCADICKRNGIKELKWKGDKSLIGNIEKQNMTVHRWFSNKACPGDYIYDRLGKIANEVNDILGVDPNPEEKKLYRVQTGAFKDRTNAFSFYYKVKNAGFDAYLVKAGGLYKIQTGAFSERPNADKMASDLKRHGFPCFITTEAGEPVKV